MVDQTGPGSAVRSDWPHRHLLGIEQLSAADIERILNLAVAMSDVARRPIKKVPALRGKSIVMFFFEPSTRTRISFEIAAKRLSADTVNFTVSASSVAKGETFLDTALNLQAMSPDALVIRHCYPGAPHFLSRYVDAAVVNAGDGAHEHPTQALLDAMTIRQYRGTLSGLKIAIIGDIAHSRVARSHINLWPKVGSELWLCGPATMLPPLYASLPVTVTHDIDEAIAGADVIIMLRIQLERQGSLNFPSAREYRELYCLTEERLRRVARPDVIIMHPGPMNRGVEIESAVADGPYSVILPQVTNGIAVRMAILYLLLGGGREG